MGGLVGTWNGNPLGVAALWIGIDNAASGYVALESNGNRTRETMSFRILTNIYGQSPEDARTTEAAAAFLGGLSSGGDSIAPGKGRLRADADLLQPRLGPARLSHPEEYAQIMKELEGAGVKIEQRAGSLAYSPEKGGPGKMILDPDASIGALRHEYQHFLDIQAANFPGIGAYYKDLPEFARVEVRGYLREIATARQTGNADLVPRIVEKMRARVNEVLGK
jgi:hypothetical protein